LGLRSGIPSGFVDVGCCGSLDLMSPEHNLPTHAGFTRTWRGAFGGTPPLGHILRYDFYESWTRFHALPKSKRYAETEDEHQIVLSRANSLAVELFGESNMLWVATGVPAGFPLENNEIVSHLKMQKAFDWVDHTEEPEHQFTCSFCAAKTHWKSKCLDWLFALIADDKENAVVFDPTSGVVFAPYDGGFDIIGLETGTITFLEKKYASWMSARTDRL